MNRVALCLILVVAGACAPPPLYHKAGADPVRRDAVETDCRIAALQRVPRDMRTRVLAPRDMPGPACDLFGRCRHGFVRFEPARIESYDANEALRERAVAQCMAEAGFRPVRLPACGPEIRAPEPGSAQPPIGPTSCARRLPDGGWQVITPG
jgi:hypothetical protein